MFGKKKAPTPGPAQQREQAPPDTEQESGGGVLGGIAAWGNDALQGVLGLAKNPKQAVYDARLGMEGRQESVLDDAHDVSNQDVILEQLAHKGAYGGLDNRKLAGWGYKEMGAAQDPESGFRAVLFVPTEEALAGKTDQAKVITAIHGGKPPPVLAFRGTKEKRGMQDDTTKAGVGTYQFASNEGRVKDIMGMAGGKVIVAGHSLGGALAQLAATHFPGNVSRVVTFQSPGIPKEESDKLDEHNKNAAPVDQVKSTHHRAEGDAVHLAGEALTDGDVFTYGSVGVGNPMDHMSFPLARLAAARGDMIPGINDADVGDKGGDKLVNVEKTSAKDEKDSLIAKGSEGARKFFGGAVRDKTMDKYVTVWKDVKSMIDSKAFGKNYVLGVIKDNPDLTPDQKVKMRDQATKLLEA